MSGTVETLLDAQNIVGESIVFRFRLRFCFWGSFLGSCPFSFRLRLCFFGFLGVRF